MTMLHKADYDNLMFETFNQWWKHGPNVGNEYHPDPKSISQTYQEWLNENPHGYVCSVE